MTCLCCVHQRLVAAVVDPLTDMHCGFCSAEVCYSAYNVHSLCGLYFLSLSQFVWLIFLFIFLGATADD